MVQVSPKYQVTKVHLFDLKFIAHVKVGLKFHHNPDPVQGLLDHPDSGPDLQENILCPVCTRVKCLPWKDWVWKVQTVLMPKNPNIMDLLHTMMTIFHALNCRSFIFSFLFYYCNRHFSVLSLVFYMQINRVHHNYSVYNLNTGCYISIRDIECNAPLKMSCLGYTHCSYNIR